LPRKLTSSSAGMATTSTMEESLLATVEHDLDRRGGRSVKKALARAWKSSLFIIGVEVAERMTYYGIASNLITYLTDVLHQSTATAATNVNIWSGVTSTLPFLGAFLADAYWGRYRTIVASSFVYLLGLILLTVSVSLKFLRPPPCIYTSSSCPEATPVQNGLFFCSLYLIALGTGGHKPCIEAFGADQFDGEDPEERRYRSSFFNWWYFGQCFGALIALSVLLYIEDYIGWGVGFGIPTVAMALALSLFLYGSKFYRHQVILSSPFMGRKTVSDTEVGKSLVNRSRTKLSHTDQFRSLDKGCLEKSAHDTVLSAKEVNLFARLIPIWVTCLMYGVVFAQCSTFFTKQGSTMDRKIIEHIEIPPASLQCFIALSILVLVPVYDWILVPLAKKFTGLEHGITVLQRVGFGIFFSVLAMVVAALTELKRLKVAKDNDLVNLPNATIPMTIFWLLPQYILYGISEVLAMVGMQEYFYDQMPNRMRSLGIAVFLSVLGIGSFLSGIIISIVDEISSRSKEGSWFQDNLNRAHLDYFYWLLAALSALNLCTYIYFSSCRNGTKSEESISGYEEVVS